MSTIVNRAAGTLFQPASPIRVARNMLLMAVRLVLVTLAAWRLDGWLAVALWLLAALTAFGLVVTVTTVERVNAERERRINALPIAWRNFLRNDGEAPR